MYLPGQDAGFAQTAGRQEMLPVQSHRAHTPKLPTAIATETPEQYSALGEITQWMTQLMMQTHPGMTANRALESPKPASENLKLRALPAPDPTPAMPDDSTEVVSEVLNS